MSEEHVYGLDEIKEADNKFPLWLVFVYVLLTSWGIYYLVTFWVMPGDEKRQEVLNAPSPVHTVVYNNLNERNAKHPYPSFSEEDLIKGKDVFTANCSTCHSAGLDASAYKHGSSAGAISRNLRNGIAGTAMAPWKDVLSNEELFSLVAYVDSLNNDKHLAKIEDHAKKESSH